MSLSPAWRRAALVATSLATIALPAAAYLPPASAILKRVAQKRNDVGLAAVQVQGTLVLAGEAARRAPASGVASGSEVTYPAYVLVKAPGRCRLELAPEGVGASERPSVSMRGSRLSGRRGLEALPAAVALVQGVCTLLSEQAGGAAERALAQALASRGIAFGDVALGRLGGRVAFVLGGRPQQPAPQAWIDKQSFQPVRLIARVGDRPRDVRLLDYGSPVAGEGFPRAVEVWDGSQLEARFTAERLTPNPKLSDAMF